MQPRILLPLAAAALVLATPAAANAAITTSLQGATLTVTGDQVADDNVIIAVNAQGQLTNNFGAANGFADAADFDAAQAGSQPIVAGTVGIVANLGGGNDAINLNAALVNGSTLNGEAGDDILVGGPAADTLSGGEGNDRLTGFRGSDTVNGDAGNDTMIWNNGDGTDSNTGGGGVDETQVNASERVDGMTVKATPNGFRFDRTTAVAFGIDIVDVDRLAINGFGGNDTLATDPGVTLPMTIDGGPGDDAMITGDGADVISGGDGNDTLNGSGGGDRIIGDRGNDTKNGGAGDDTIVWNNGDNNDVMNGDAGVDRVETNLSANNDVSTMRIENGRTRYDRTSAVAFNLSIDTAEAFELNSLAGNDTLTTAPGVTIPVIADGGAGNDVFNVREGAAGFFFGGGDGDTATIDAIDTVAADVETVDRPAGPPVLAPGAGKLAKTATVKKRVASVKVTCPAGTSGCTGYVTLLRGRTEIGRKAYTVEAGATKTVKVKLAKLPKRKTLTVTARTSSRAAADKETKLKLSFR